VGADQLVARNGYELVKFFFLLTFAAAIPAIISGGIAERARFGPQLVATAVIVGIVYPLFEGVAWNQRFGIQGWIKSLTGAEFHDFAGSIVVHAVGGWLALPAVLLLGRRSNRYRKDGAISAHPPSNIPFLALGAWVLTVGWFGFNVMSAQTIDKVSGLVAVNSLLAMVGGTLAALLPGPQRPRLRAQRAAGRAGGRLRRQRRDASRWARWSVGGGAGAIFVADVHADPEPLEDRRRAGRVAAARPVRPVGRHRLRHLRQQASAARGVSLARIDRQLLGVAGAGLRFCVYGVIKAVRPAAVAEKRQRGADLRSTIGSTPEREATGRRAGGVPRQRLARPPQGLQGCSSRAINRAHNAPRPTAAGLRCVCRSRVVLIASCGLHRFFSVFSGVLHGQQTLRGTFPTPTATVTWNRLSAIRHVTTQS
jgi:Amt family ammonium transporter